MVNPSLRSFTAFVLLIATCCTTKTRAQHVIAKPARGTASRLGTPWWKGSLIYEIYPRSFQDSDGDGVGDLNGITQRLDYLRALGVDAVWIAPIFPSPQVDFGYDISDYEKIDPQFGTLGDFDRLVAEAKKRKIRVLLDMVLNHTSEQHAWFRESRSSRTNSKSDWFIWSDGIAADAPEGTAFQRKWEHDGRVPPNNWLGNFGGSAWTWCAERKQFYYHNFYSQQPDLNWRNPQVEEAMFDAMRFWLKRGVAGFRLDAVTNMFEDPALRNNPQTGTLSKWGDPDVELRYTDNLPEVHGVVRRLRALVDSFDSHPVLLGETYLPNTAALDAWYGGEAHNELQLPMDMLIGVRGGTYSAEHFRRTLSEVQTQVHGSEPLVVFDNHDNPRSWNRFGDGVNDARIARQIATLLLTPRATALMYYGQELGMTTNDPARREDVRDPKGITGWPKHKGRDGERTPMQWDDAAQSGFSANAKTWLPVAPDYAERNVKTESSDPQSLLNWYRQLIALRRSHPALRTGSMTMVNPGSQTVLSYVRMNPSGKGGVFVAMNMSAQPQTMHFDVAGVGLEGKGLHTVLTSDAEMRSTSSLEEVKLPPFATWIAEVR